LLASSRSPFPWSRHPRESSEVIRYLSGRCRSKPGVLLPVSLSDLSSHPSYLHIPCVIRVRYEGDAQSEASEWELGEREEKAEQRAGAEELRAGCW